MQLRVLVLEDSAERMKVLRPLLKDCEVDHYEDCGPALLGAKPPYDLLLLDHDLGGRTFVPSEDENTGHTFVSSEVGQAVCRDTTVIVHSHNWDGAQRMVKAAKEAGASSAIWVPFSTAFIGMLPRVLETIRQAKYKEEKEEEKREDVAG